MSNCFQRRALFSLFSNVGKARAYQTKTVQGEIVCEGWSVMDELTTDMTTDERQSFIGNLKNQVDYFQLLDTHLFVHIVSFVVEFSWIFQLSRVCGRWNEHIQCVRWADIYCGVTSIKYFTLGAPAVPSAWALSAHPTFLSPKSSLAKLRAVKEMPECNLGFICKNGPVPEMMWVCERARACVLLGNWTLECPRAVNVGTTIENWHLLNHSIIPCAEDMILFVDRNHQTLANAMVEPIPAPTHFVAERVREIRMKTGNANFISFLLDHLRLVRVVRVEVPMETCEWDEISNILCSRFAKIRAFSVPMLFRTQIPSRGIVWILFRATTRLSLVVRMV